MTHSLSSITDNSLIIAAHPDDELLWFAAILHKVDRVIIAFEDFWPDPNMGPARAKALTNYPRNNVSSLRLSEAATYGCADWNNPEVSQWGIELGRTCELRDAKQKALRLAGKSKAPKSGIRVRYQSNFDELTERLRPELSADMNVFTHNPWGEYGHEDHVQLHQVLIGLREEIGFNLWMSNYCTERALPLAKRYFNTVDNDFVELPVNRAFADEVAQVYREAGCWTWADDWQWFKSECYLPAPSNQSKMQSQGHLFPLNLFNIDPV